VTARPRAVPIDGTPVIDLDARKAARLESSGVKTIRFGGRDWELKPELPMQCVENFTAGDLVGAFRRILVKPEQAELFLASEELTREDMEELMQLVYGVDLGKR
jgi:hypothetical protein